MKSCTTSKLFAGTADPGGSSATCGGDCEKARCDRCGVTRHRGISSDRACLDMTLLSTQHRHRCEAKLNFYFVQAITGRSRRTEPKKIGALSPSPSRRPRRRKLLLSSSSPVRVNHLLYSTAVLTSLTSL
jgi:hypothetical protein